MAQLKAGNYWVRFGWGWEPAQFDGDHWLRHGVDGACDNDVLEIGEAVYRAHADLTNN